VRASPAAAASSAGGGDGKVVMSKEATTSSWKIEYTGEKPETPLLDTINYPVHMKNLSNTVLHLLRLRLAAGFVHMK
jgi:1-deoxy-D-xylulose-5-phosphate synthase